MEQSEVENVQKEISTKIKLPKEEKQKIYKKIFVNLLIALAILIYFIFLNLGYMRLEKEVFENDLKVFAVILICSTIYFIEKAYKTDRGTYLSYAIELFVLSVITLYMPYVYYYHNSIAQFLFTTSAVYIFIYYAIKSIVIYVINKNRYISCRSDVKEIVKDEKISYLDEESSKKFENTDSSDSSYRLKEEKDKKEKQRIKAILENNKKTPKKKTEKNKQSSKKTKLNDTETKKTKTSTTKKVDKTKEKNEEKLDNNKENKKTKTTSDGKKATKKTSRKKNGTKEKVEESSKETENKKKKTTVKKNYKTKKKVAED